ncbi:MAG: hypothetical protein A2275_07980 [Bacteroidetes bacterium RIFOXYA12_FULL_35_11]|nr:MAG: hypothetical protein A2X01_14960 [Bacteroidetes bacterium GWF2_35_48]OFY76218.1 MAG: hypothetical protein A2275_07980 [Bacteroidetes bacterium RIFOXYA12_FULL_35_11]OFY97369.1 MAG: hypothetical protein A2491_08150 [Bacteroidetes bacterium RIFOXYC12_FULL_35_7]HBX53039.1 hypothetical protein [Bacteroidales bacterium]
MINKFLSNKFFPISLKLISLVAFIGLMIIGFSSHSEDAAILMELRNTNLANLFVWSYWWPLIVLAAIFFGRVWCMVCPVELITAFFARIGLKKKRPKWILSGWGITIFYSFILIVGINIFAIHRNPAYMATYLTTIIIVSIFIGLIYEKNTFCRYVCPVGNLLGLYSKLSFFGWRVKNTNVCDSCKDKSCIHKDHIYNFNYKSCGVDLYPAKIKDNSQCILCAGCLKTCKEYQSKQNPLRPNPAFIKTGFAKDLFQIEPLSLAEFFFLFVVSGFVIYEILSEYSTAEKILLFVPTFFTQYFSIENSIIKILFQCTFLFLIVPSILWFFPYLILRLSKIKISILNYLKNFCLIFIPIIIAAHFDKAILKTTSRLPYIENAFKDVRGMNTANAIINNQMVVSKIPTWAENLISLILLSALIGGFILSYKVITKLIIKYQIESAKWILYIISFLYFLIFFLDIIFWRFLS